MTPARQQALNDLHDILHHEDLHRAVQGELDEGAIMAAAFLARALGCCRLYGADPGDHNGSLPEGLLVPVLLELSRRCVGATSDLTLCELQCDAAAEEIEREFLAEDCLRVRMDVWATWIALDERIARLVQDHADRPDIATPLAQCLEALEQYDLELRARADLLLPARPECRRWLSELTEEFRQTPPWWLSDSFWENVDRESRRVCDVLTWMPRPVAAQGSMAPSMVPAEPWLTAARTGRPIVAAPVLAAGAVESQGTEYTFQSDRESATSAIARIRVPDQYNPDGQLIVQASFVYARMAPTQVCEGSVARLGPDVATVITCVREGSQDPYYQCEWRLSAEQVKALRLEHVLRLRVGGRDWIAVPEQR
jgi:hypothetical protein